jgi:hypothetical protein
VLLLVNGAAALLRSKACLRWLLSWVFIVGGILCTPEQACKYETACRHRAWPAGAGRTAPSSVASLPGGKLLCMG